MANQVTSQVIPLTARKAGPAAIYETRPKVHYFQDGDIKTIRRGDKTNGGCVIIQNSDRRKYEVYETAGDVRTAILAQAASTDPYEAGDINLAVSAAGSVLTAGTVLSAYLNKVTALTVTTGNAVTLPAPSAGRNVLVVINSGSAPLAVFPHGASAFIDSGASGASKAVAVNQRMHFATQRITTGGASAIWQSAIDDGNLS